MWAGDVVGRETVRAMNRAPYGGVAGLLVPALRPRRRVDGAEHQPSAWRAPSGGHVFVHSSTERSKAT